METKLLICRHCGNAVDMMQDAGVPLMCCGEKMHVLKPNTVEASGEKHLPVVERAGDKVCISVGKDAHPMTEEHWIAWIGLQTENGMQRKQLHAGEAPSACFCTLEDKPVAAWAYCNLHSLWMTRL